MTETPELLPIGAVAREFNVSVRTIRRWEAAGKISAIRLPGGHRRFHRADIDALLTPDTEKETRHA